MSKKKYLFAITDEMLVSFEKSIDFKFTNHKTLKEALTHRSYANEIGKNIKYNERLEFLGDSVLNFSITDYLYKEFDNIAEGELAKMRCYLVSSDTLAEVAMSIDLGKYIQLGYGEEETGGREKKTILENSLEALIGAMYIDAGIVKTKAFVIKIFNTQFKKLENNSYYNDSKTMLQEIIQNSYKILPEYKLIKEERNKNKYCFTIGVFVGEKKYAEGIGSSKKEAERSAAIAALEFIKNNKKKYL